MATTSRRLLLTDAACRKLKAGDDGARVEYWDSRTPALALRVGARRRSWILMVRVLRAGRWVLTRVTLGQYPQMTLAQARAAAEEARDTAAAGGNPGRPAKEARAALELASRHTFEAVRSDFFDRYLTRSHRRVATRTQQQRRRILEGADFTEWAQRPLSSITRADVRKVLERIIARGAPAMANATLAHLRVLIRWAMQQEIIENDPTAGLRSPGVERSRERVLSLEEIRALWRATADGELYSDLVRMLLLTGARRAEWGNARWDEFEEIPGIGECLSIPAARMKNGRPLLIALSDPAIEILQRRRALAVGPSVFGLDRGFTRWSECKGILDARVAIDPWRLHDLRRTFVTYLNEHLRIAPHVVESCVGHVGPFQRGVAGTYNRASYLLERKAAMDAWGSFLRELVGEGKTHNVVAFASRPAP